GSCTMFRPRKGFRFHRIGAVLAAVLLLPSCGPKGPAPGSPEWLYQAAKDAFQNGDVVKTQEHLEKLQAQPGNPFQGRAAAWDLLVKSGRLLGHEELVDIYAN